jgi:hypothetical protein
MLLHLTAYARKSCVHGSCSFQRSEVDPHYLLTSPQYPNSSYKITKVYLENATSWVSTKNPVTINGEKFAASENSSIIVVNGTVRNDYSTEEIIKLSKEGQSNCYVGLDICLYDSQGNFISTLNRGNPFRGCIVLSLRGGEETSSRILCNTNK